MHVLLGQNLIKNLFKSSAAEMMVKYTMLKSSYKVTTTQYCLLFKVKYNTMETIIYLQCNITKHSYHNKTWQFHSFLFYNMHFLKHNMITT